MNMIPAQMQIPGLDMTANLHSVATEVLCLMNMVEVEELMDDEEYEGKSSTDVVLLFEGIGHLSPLRPTSLSNRPLSKCIEEHRDSFEVEGTNLHLCFAKTSSWKVRKCSIQQHNEILATLCKHQKVSVFPVFKCVFLLSVLVTLYRRETPRRFS